MFKNGNKLEIYIADLKPEVQVEVLKMFDVTIEDKNYRNFLYGKPISIIPDAWQNQGTPTQQFITDVLHMVKELNIPVDTVASTLGTSSLVILRIIHSHDRGTKYDILDSEIPNRYCGPAMIGNVLKLYTEAPTLSISKIAEILSVSCGNVCQIILREENYLSVQSPDWYTSEGAMQLKEAVRDLVSKPEDINIVVLATQYDMPIYTTGMIVRRYMDELDQEVIDSLPEQLGPEDLEAAVEGGGITRVQSELPDDSGEWAPKAELPDDSGEWKPKAELPDDSGDYFQLPGEKPMRQDAGDLPKSRHLM